MRLIQQIRIIKIYRFGTGLLQVKGFTEFPFHISLQNRYIIVEPGGHRVCLDYRKPLLKRHTRVGAYYMFFFYILQLVGFQKNTETEFKTALFSSFSNVADAALSSHSVIPSLLEI